MFDFTYHTPTEVVFGRGAENRTGALLKARGCKKVLIHYGGGSVVRSGLLARVKASLDAAEVPYVELGGVVPNPRLSLVYRGIELAKDAGVDFILAVGGGSVIDSAKAIGYGVANEGDVWDFYAHTRQAKACLPIGAVLTIAAAGSEMSNSSVITNEENWFKRGYNNDICRPALAIMNPELTMTLPAYQTACGCTDIMMHTMERYFVSGGCMELTDRIAEGLLRTVMKNALVLRDNDFATHLMEHEVGGMFDVAHGAGLAALWGSWARYVYRECLPRFHAFAVNVMDVADEGAPEEVALRGIEAMETFYRAIGMPTSFAELGLRPTEEQLVTMARQCSVASGGKKGSAKVLYEKDMLEIYRMAAAR